MKGKELPLFVLLILLLLALRFREKVTSTIRYDQPPVPPREPQPPPWTGKLGDVVIWDGVQWAWTELLSTGWKGWVPIGQRAMRPE